MINFKTIALLFILLLYCAFIKISLSFLFIFLGNQTILGFQGKDTILSQKKMVEIQVNPYKSAHAYPAHLKIPSINVDADVEYTGLTPNGAMDMPQNIGDVGWYKLGPIPGESGNAVIAGHFDGIKNQQGVFNNLDKLNKGDKIYVLNHLGEATTFIVRESREFDPGFADEVFLSGDNGKHLNLVTCDGFWNTNLKGYSKRLVVFADSSNF